MSLAQQGIKCTPNHNSHPLKMLRFTANNEVTLFDAHLLSQNQGNKETEKKSEKTAGGKKITKKEAEDDEISSAAGDVKISEPIEKQVALSQPSTNTYIHGSGHNKSFSGLSSSFSHSSVTCAD